MKINPTPIEGLKLIFPEPHVDDRGSFWRSFCKREFSAAGIDMDIVQMNNSSNTKAQTLRGLRYQLPPAAEIKLIRCVRGAMFDFAVDLRPDSPTYKQWFGTELNEVNGAMMCIPRGFAHGYVTLAEKTEVLYHVSDFYSPALERGIRFDDPSFNIVLPVDPLEIAEKDRRWPDFSEEANGVELFRGAA